MNWRIIIISNCFLIVSCNDKKPTKDQFSGTSISTYYQEGQLKSVTKVYNSNSDYKVYQEFYRNGKQKYKDATYRDKWVGPLEFYDSNGLLTLYNEIDINKGVYYVKKYEKGKLIKEEGVALSPLLFNTSLDSIKKNLMFFYSEPPGYTNEIKVYLNNEEINYIRMPSHHIGLISLNDIIIDSARHQNILIKAILKFNNAVINTKVVKETILRY